jgi:hypothetical protein
MCKDSKARGVSLNAHAGRSNAHNSRKDHQDQMPGAPQLLSGRCQNSHRNQGGECHAGNQSKSPKHRVDVEILIVTANVE